MMALKKISLLSMVSAAAVLGGANAATAAAIDTNMAHMRAMDKIVGRVSEIDVPVNGEAVFGSFSIVVRRCTTTPPEETPENTAFVDVVDNYDTDHPVNIFKGWMMSSSPALNAVEHPIYDVWLLRCIDGNTQGKKILTEAELAARDELPMKRDEEAGVSSTMSRQPSAAPAETAPASDTVTATTTVDQPETAQSETVSVVVTAPAEQNDDEPRALLQIQEQEMPVGSEVIEEDGFIQFEDDNAESGTVAKTAPQDESVAEESAPAEEQPASQI